MFGESKIRIGFKSTLVQFFMVSWQSKHASRGEYGKDMMIALCGDLWDYPDRFRTDYLLLWPIYVDYTIEEWNSGTLDEYAAQAYLAAKDVLMINPMDNKPVNHGGSFHFRNGRSIERIPFEQEGILIAEILQYIQTSDLWRYYKGIRSQANNEGMIHFLRSKGYTVLNLIEIRKPYEGEKLTATIHVEKEVFDYQIPIDW